MMRNWKGRAKSICEKNRKWVWAKQKTSLDKTKDEIGQNRRKVWAKQKESLGETEGGFVIKRSEQRLLPLDFPFSRWPLAQGASYRIIILWLTSVQGAGWRPSKRFAQGNALGRTNAPMRPEGAKASGNRPFDGAKAFAPAEGTLNVCDWSLINSKSWIIFFGQIK